MSNSIDEVGYKKPPKSTQWVKGAPSPNPSGRPKGAKNMKTRLYEMLAEEITVTTEHGKKRVTISEATVTKLMELALKGDLKSIKYIIETEAQIDHEISTRRPKKDPDVDKLHKYLFSFIHGEDDDPNHEEKLQALFEGDPFDAKTYNDYAGKEIVPENWDE